MTSCCIFCGEPTDGQKIASSPVCPRCRRIFVCLAEVLIEMPDPVPSCEACDGTASWLIDGHPLCESCHSDIRPALERRVLALGMVGTMQAINDLPETEDEGV